MGCTSLPPTPHPVREGSPSLQAKEAASWVGVGRAEATPREGTECSGAAGAGSAPELLPHPAPLSAVATFCRRPEPRLRTLFCTWLGVGAGRQQSSGGCLQSEVREGGLHLPTPQSRFLSLPAICSHRAWRLPGEGSGSQVGCSRSLMDSAPSVLQG